MPRRPLLAALALACAALVAGCGGGDTAATPQVRGAAVDPGDGALVLATPDGLARVPPGRSLSEPGPGAPHDLTGIAAVGPGHYLASGRAAPGSPLPDVLGLVETTDGGRTWTRVGQPGRAGLRAIRAVGPTVAGVDAETGDLLVSADRGRTWTGRAAPSPLVDLAVDPARPDRLVGVTASALARTEDGGRTWGSLREGPGLLAWPASGELWRVDAEGTATRSADGGVTWTPAGSVDGAPLAVASPGPGRLVVVRDDGAVLRTRDAGATWSEPAEVR